MFTPSLSSLASLLSVLVPRDCIDLNRTRLLHWRREVRSMRETPEQWQYKFDQAGRIRGRSRRIDSMRRTSRTLYLTGNEITEETICSVCDWTQGVQVALEPDVSKER